MKNVLATLTFATVLLISVSSFAADRVVVVTLGGAVGDAVASDVVKGKTFSSKAGKGVTGTLERHPMAQTFVTPWYFMTFNLIPAGSFTMGSPADEAGRGIDEGPQVETTISQPFYMQISEVTQGQWAAVVLAAEFWGHIPVDQLVDAPSFYNGNPGNPVESVSYEDVQTWIGLLNILEGRTGCDGTDIHAACYRLPTEAEWEYAARAGTTTAYANPYNYDLAPAEIGAGFNPNLATMGWYWWNNTTGGYPSGPKPVMRKQANGWGLYDMHGNVQEWCRDWYSATYYSLVPPERPASDPEGLSSGSNRVIRGGGWFNGAWFARSAFRITSMPDFRYDLLGFRLALPPGQ